MSNEPTDLRILKRARFLISHPSRWTTRAYARDTAGHEVGATEHGAASFCAVGAIRRAAYDVAKADGQSKLFRSGWLGYGDIAFCLAAAVMGGQDNINITDAARQLVVINDTLGHPEVLQRFDAKIVQLEQEMTTDMVDTRS